MSPDELTLRCSRSDGMGHFAVDYRLEVRLGLDASVVLNARFILDSEFFARTVRELEDVLGCVVNWNVSSLYLYRLCEPSLYSVG